MEDDNLKKIFDNVPIGFLIIDKNGDIISRYSKESLRILALDKEPKNKKFSEIFFSNNAELLDEFDFGHSEIIKTSDNLTKELLLSLLPNEHIINDIVFSIEYKMINDDHCMVIIKDITKI